jgi:NTP pyrophosphatase (non-canonical NTP hydrolase)
MATQDIPDLIDFTHVQTLIEAFHKRFPNGNTPYQMLARLCEEGGELAEQVNLAEARGLQESQRAGFAKEIEDVIRASLTIGKHYQLEFSYRSFEDAYVLIDPALQSKTPFQLISHLCESMGSISKKVNHAQDMGVKQKKYGLLDYQAFAQAIEQSVILAFSLSQYYQLQNDVQKAFLGSFIKMSEQGFI